MSIWQYRRLILWLSEYNRDLLLDESELVLYNVPVTKNMKKFMITSKNNTFKTQAAKLMTIAILALVIAFAFAFVPSKTSASTSEYWGIEGDYGSQYYYEPEYDYYGSYYEPEYDYYGSYYQPEYDYYGSSDYYDYSYPSYSSPSYTYQPQSYDYQYYSRPQSTPYMYTPAPNYVYQYTTPSNTNVNANSSNSNSNAVANNTNVNNNNNVNNNPINIVINGGTPISGTVNPPAQYLDGNCYISPSNVYINQDVTFTANATGGNGNYTYSWSGSDGISSNSRTFTGRFSTFGPKTATVIIYSNGQSISRTCSTNVEGNYYPNNNLGVYCIASPLTATIGQNVIWTAYVTGGNNYGYTYSWSGTDGLSYGNSQAIQKTYSTGGVKSATVTVYGNGRTETASCNMTVTGGAPISNVTVIREPGAGQPISGVFLSQVPATGISFGWKVALFILGLLIWSGYVGYVMVNRRKRLATAGISSVNVSAVDRINQFKLDNMRKRGLIK